MHLWELAAVSCLSLSVAVEPSRMQLRSSALFYLAWNCANGHSSRSHTSMSLVSSARVWGEAVFCDIIIVFRGSGCGQRKVSRSVSNRRLIGDLFANTQKITTQQYIFIICLDTAFMASRGDVSIFQPDIHQLAAKLIMPPLNSCDAATAGCGFVQINLQILVVKLNINLGT